MQRYGYVRGSGNNDEIDRQISAILNQKVSKQQLYIDEKIENNFQGSEFEKMIQQLHSDDVVFISSIDRLGRTYDEIMNHWKLLTIDNDINVVVLDFPLLDTRRPAKDLDRKVFADIILQVLSYITNLEKKI